ncbi:MAG: BMC domain-containing protein [Thermoguttaceae bacterium]|nr:BMC domain-containing protein [Thermoguttaceae bacterium]
MNRQKVPEVRIRMEKTMCVGVIEFQSVGKGMLAQDEMMKTASVSVLFGRTICSGKYLIAICGGVDEVQTAVDTGVRIGGEAVIDFLVCPKVHPAVFAALGQSVILPSTRVPALGIVESFGACSILAASDFAAKSGNVTLIRLHLAMALGGKGLLMLVGPLSDVKTSTKAAADEVRRRGLLVSEVVISNPAEELLMEYI